MQPNFPGMNPYLENPALWPEVHFGLIAALARTLNPLIRPKYRAAVEKRVYWDALLVGIPDVAVVQRRSDGVKSERSTTQGATALVTEPLVSEPLMVTVPLTEEVQERFLEIRDVSTGMVVTVVEVLSPKNKRAGEGNIQYDAKRQQILNSSAHLVEIDLLRAGEPKPIAGGVSADYRILVSRADQRPRAELYAFNLSDRLPRFLLPLRPGDPEPLVDLQQCLEQVYADAALDLAIDYSQPAVPPLSD